MEYTIRVKIEGPGCDMDFVHVSSGRELADYAKQFASIVSAGRAGPASAGGGDKDPYRKKAVGVRVKADGFDCPSEVFDRASRAGAKQRLETEIGAAAPRMSEHASVHDAIFGGDEYDFDPEGMQLGGGPVGNYSCSRK